MNVKEEFLRYDAESVSDLLVMKMQEDPPEGPPGREGYVTFFDPGVSIVFLREHVSACDLGLRADPWFRRRTFGTVFETPVWRQLRIQAIPSAPNLTYHEQVRLLGPQEEVPSARAVVMGMIIHFLATGERLFPHFWLRTRTRLDDFRCQRVAVGCFDYSGIGLASFYDGSQHPIVDLASVRRS